MTLEDELHALGLVCASDDDDGGDDLLTGEHRRRSGDEVEFTTDERDERDGDARSAHWVVEEQSETYDFDEALAFLCESFPDFDANCLEEALINTGGDVELAMELLMDEDVPEVQAPMLDDAEAFPSLGGSSTVGAAVKQRKDGELPNKIFLSGGMSNVNKASASAIWNASTRALKSDGMIKVERNEPVVGAKTKIEWVETGAAVSQLYKVNRDEARDHARVRNVCYEQATNAFLAGNKALAKELSRQGREAAAKMAAAHSGAAASIFASRGGGRGGVIDLHGLHVAEALALLRRELPRLRDGGEPYARVLVGTGHHTVGSRTPSRLPVAVETFLHQERWRFSEPQSGCLEVKLL